MIKLIYLFDKLHFPLHLRLACCSTFAFSLLLIFLKIVHQNVAPAHAPDIVIFVDAISIVVEEVISDDAPSSLPIACIEAGNDHSLPNLSLRLLFFLSIFMLFVFLLVRCHAAWPLLI